MTKRLRVVAHQHVLQIAECKTHPFNLFFAEMSRAPPDCEASFRGTVYEVRSRAQVAGHRRIGIYRFARRGGSAIAVLADESIDCRVFAECSYSRREDDQFGAVGQRHARSINRLVAEPRAVTLIWIEIDDSRADGRVERLAVHFQAPRGGALKALGVVANEKAAHCKLAVGSAADYGKHVDNGQLSADKLGSVIVA